MYEQKLSRIGIIITLVVMCITSALYAAGTWRVLHDSDKEIRDYHAITFVSPKKGWTVGVAPLEMDNPGFLGQTNDGGRTWEKVELDVNKILSNIHFYREKHGWGVGDGGMIIHTEDGGKRWGFQQSNVFTWLYGVYFVNEKVGYTVGVYETVLKTTNGGRGVGWEVLSGGIIPGGQGNDPAYMYNAVHFADELTGWVAGVYVDPIAQTQNSVIRKTLDGGQTWINQPTNTEDIIKDIFFIDASTGWAAGENGLMLYTTNGGDTWNIQESSTEENLMTVRFADANVGWAGGGGYGVSAVIHTIDSGETWQTQTIDDSRISKMPVFDIFILDKKHVWITGEQGMVLEYK